ncbi:ribonuclease H-like domain-containing protein [Tanacetum coccineum]|uniref:Ribonuclease H-like domain-containing protein n=1 Tax=Tanacetum coccineum TaxID=301880 RepID=A0ABQ5HH67_9ASTR
MNISLTLSDDEASYREDASDNGKFRMAIQEENPQLEKMVVLNRVFEQELTSTLKSSVNAQNVAFVSHSKSSTNKVKSGHTGAYSTYTPTSSNNILEREVPAGFADEVIYSLFAKQSEDLDLLHEDLEQIDDMDIEEMDINWQIAMIAIRMKKFYKKTRRRVRIDGNKLVGFDKKKLECFKCHNTGHFARECPSKGTNDGKKRDSFYQDQGAGKKEQNQNYLLTMDDGVVNWGEHTKEEVETNHALMAISSNNEVSLCSKTCIDSYNKLKTLCDEQTNQLGEQEVKILAYDQAVKKLEAQVVTFQKQQLSLNEQLTFQANELSLNEQLNGVAKPVWNNANRVNHANHFVPRPVQLIVVRQNVNSVRPNVNTGRANVNSVRQNVNSVRSNVNTGSFNINTVKAKQPINTSNSNSFSPVRPQVNKFNQRSNFSKSHSPVRRPIVRNTAKMSYTHAVKGNWGTAVKTSAGYNWRKTRPNSNCNSGSNFIRTDHPLKNMEDRGIFDSGCSGHMTGNKDHLDDFEECKGGSVTFGGSKGYITGKGRIRVEDWDAIRAKLEANTELTKDVLGKDLSEQDFAKRMVDLVNQRKKHFAEERAKAKRNKPMTQRVKQIDTFVHINIEATKAQLKRYGEELQIKISKKQRIDDKDVSDTEEKVSKV